MTPNEKSARVQCGVFGVFGHADAALMTAIGLHALQHRGLEGSGMATFSESGAFRSRRVHALARDAFLTDPRVLRELSGVSAIGHVRYATAGADPNRDLQPIHADLAGTRWALAHNGHFLNAAEVRSRLADTGATFQSSADSEVALHLAARAKAEAPEERLRLALSELEGGWALLALTADTLMGARDPLGIRPLVMGEIQGAGVLASETCALDAIGARYLRAIEPGEIIALGAKGATTRPRSKPKSARPCVFEWVYFARPDSILHGRSAYHWRQQMGHEMAREETNTEDIDLVSPVPDSGVPAALGYARGSRTPFEFAVVRNHYSGRTFILPKQSARETGVRMKHNPNPDVVEGKSVLLIDDSLVRGSTASHIVRMMRRAGAKAVHLRIASPPVRHPDFYGIDLPDKDLLLAAHRDVEAMRQLLGADSLAFLSLDGLYRALGQPQGRDPNHPCFADHVFSGDYPTRVPILEPKPATLADFGA